MITLNDWITSSNRYPERAQSPELTDEVKKNAENLIAKVNALLQDIGWTEAVSISSGFRPSGVNKNVKGAAKRSGHQTGLCIDIFQDKKDNQKLGFLIRSLQDNKGLQGVLGANGLMMEKLEYTKGNNTDWIHLDIIPRKDRPSREFIP